MVLRCLIVDDNREFLRAASDLLEHEGIRVVGVVSTGTQAYRACDELRPDVVLIDIGLGEETGFDVARNLAALADAGPPRMILMSAYTAEGYEDMIADSPVLSFLPKAHLSGTAIRGILARASN